MDVTAVRKRLTGAEGVPGRDVNGHLLVFYAESVFRARCSDLLSNLPCAGEEGFITVDGLRYGTASAWARKLSLDKSSVRKRLRHSQGITGRSASGNIIGKGFHSEQTVLSACADLLSTPQVNENGVYAERDSSGKVTTYRCVNDLSRMLGIPEPTLNRRLKRIEGKPIRDAKGRIYTFYSEAAARKQCADLLQALPQADSSGWITSGTERLTTVYKFAIVHDLSDRTVKKRIQHYAGMKGKDVPGRVRVFYCERDFHEACVDLLARKKR